MSPSQLLKRVNVFISSPSDVGPERQAIARVVERLNRLGYIRDRYVLTPLAYEQEVPPESGDFAQFIVDRYMQAKDSFLVICLMWARMGTAFTHPTTGERFQSGTEYEFRTAYQANQETGLPHILLYRKTADAPDADPAQKAQVEGFFNKFHNAEFKGLYKTFNTLEEFEAMLFDHVEKIVHEYLSNAEEPSPSEAGTPGINNSYNRNIHVGGDAKGFVYAEEGSRVVIGENPRIKMLERENNDLGEKLTELNKQLKQVRTRERIKRESHQTRPDDQLMKLVIPLLVVLVAAGIGASIHPVIGLVIGIGAVVFFLQRASTPASETSTAPSEEVQIEEDIAGTQAKIQQNKAEIKRLEADT